MRKNLTEIMRKRYFDAKKQPIFEHLLKPELVSLSDGESVISMLVGEEHLNIQRKVHGGVLASLADLAMGVACITYDKQAVTSDMNIAYIGTATEGEELFAKAKVIHNGKTLIRTTCLISNAEGRLLVSASATFFVIGVLPNLEGPSGLSGL